MPWRSTLCASLGFDEARVSAVRQTHSLKVVRVDGQDHESLAAMDADGMVTARADLLLTVTVADCLPIFLWDRRTSAVGLVHSGWKGTGIAAEAIGLMAREFGTLAGDLAVAIGPGIGPCCYDVPRERFESFKERFGESCVARDSEGSFRLDLKRANIELLEREGVTDTSAVRDCTCCSAGLGSFRRQGASGFTRMLAFIGWF
jgi:hypothetical protein